VTAGQGPGRPAPAARGREVVIEIESLAFGGDAVGREVSGSDGGQEDIGRVTFVALAAPGERVRARIVREKGRVAWAELMAIERPGPSRVAPLCPLFGRCGGCQWQHVALDAQRAAKHAIVERALRPTPVRDVAETLPACGSPNVAPIVDLMPPFGYRERTKLVVGRGGAVGFRARRSHAVIDVPACPLMGVALARAWPALRALGRAARPGVEIDAHAGAEGVVANVRGARGELDPKALGGSDLAGVAIDGRTVTGVESVDVAEAGGGRLRVPGGAFAQVGRGANGALVSAVLDAVGKSPGVTLELYAGSGNFTRHLVARATGVHATDGDPAAVRRGRSNVPSAAWSDQPPAIDADTVLLDPPREGGDRAHLVVAARARRRIVYVSCDPQTLARDARELRAAGFALTAAVPLDLMPQTFHVEIVATFDRVSRAAQP
jgi:tRNA/tmRNA/rRNA uracil-C5-methylase (TrmA/RlmC/RlmD family)